MSESAHRLPSYESLPLFSRIIPQLKLHENERIKMAGYEQTPFHGLSSFLFIFSKTVLTKYHKT